MKENRIDQWAAIRPFRLSEDMPRLATLCTQIEAVDQDGNEASEAALQGQIKYYAPGHNPEQDRWVIEAPDDPNRLIGHAWVFRQSSERVILDVAVHPIWRRRGLGSLLLTHTLSQARVYGASHVTGGAKASNPGSQAFLHHHGFWLAGHNRHLYATADISLPPLHWPIGYDVKSYAEVQHLSTLVEAYNRSYGDMWGHRENVEGAMNETYLAQAIAKFPDRYVPEGIFIAFAHDGEVAGVCNGRLGSKLKINGERRKIIDSPGVVPEHRSHNLQGPLVVSTMHWLRRFGSGPIELFSYGDQEKAVQIYQELGFTLAAQDHLLEYCLDLC